MAEEKQKNPREKAKELLNKYFLATRDISEVAEDIEISRTVGNGIEPVENQLKLEHETEKRNTDFKGIRMFNSPSWIEINQIE